MRIEPSAWFPADNLSVTLGLFPRKLGRGLVSVRCSMHLPREIHTPFSFRDTQAHRKAVHDNYPFSLLTLP